MQTLGAAGVGLVAGTTATAEEERETDGPDDSDGDGPTEIESCTVIDEPGEYELVADLAPETLDRGACIVIDSDGVTLRGNGHTIDLSGVEQDGGREYSFAGSRVGIVINPDPSWMYEADNWRTTVSDVVVRGGSAGVTGWMYSGHSEFTGVTSVKNGLGFYFYGGNCVLENCVVSENRNGIRLSGDEPDGAWLRMTDSTVRANDERGINVLHGSSAGVNDSRIVDNGIGMTNWEYSGSYLEDCHICRNEDYGVHNALMIGDESHPSAQGWAWANNCYWGAANGPSSFGDPEEPYTDPQTGRPADGDGDAVSESLEPGVSNVRFDPFREEPIDRVGADR